MPKPKSDKAFLAHLKREAPEALEADVDFDKVVTHILRADPDTLGLRRPRKRKRKRRKSTQTE